jgi:ABC-type transport system involved in multi-copper enzyme maturation permease subunit
MNQLIKIEFKKIVKTTYFIGSFLAMIILPLISLVLLLLKPSGFVSGDFNRLNILLMALVMSKSIFPLVAMSLVQVGNGLAGLKSVYLTPISRWKIIISKILMAFIWMLILIAFGIALVIIIEVILFKNMHIISLVISSLKVYGQIALYSFGFQVIGMILTIELGNILVPSLMMIAYMLLEYGIQLQYMKSYLPGAIPAYLSGVTGVYPNIHIAFIIHFVIAFIGLVYILSKLMHQDYIE